MVTLYGWVSAKMWPWARRPNGVVYCAIASSGSHWLRDCAPYN